MTNSDAYFQDVDQDLNLMQLAVCRYANTLNILSETCS